MDYVGKPRATHKKMQQHTNQLDWKNFQPLGIMFYGKWKLQLKNFT
jgi:hypothetical protein